MIDEHKVIGRYFYVLFFHIYNRVFMVDYRVSFKIITRIAYLVGNCIFIGKDKDILRYWANMQYMSRIEIFKDGYRF